MSRFKAGDRVKILAGHPYDLRGEKDTGTVKGRAQEEYRGTVNVAIDDYMELSFKGRELELLPADTTPAEQWVPRVGDRVRVIDPECMRTNTPVGALGVVTKIRGGDFFDIDLTHPTDGVIEQFVSANNVELVKPLTIEAGKFYRTRDGRKVGPMRFVGTSEWPWSANDGATYTSTGSPHVHGIPCSWDLVAEWVQPDSTPAPTAATTEAAKPKLQLVAGSTYRGESGAEHTVEANDDNEFWPFKTAGVSHFTSRFWKADGEPYNAEGFGSAVKGDRLVSPVTTAPTTDFIVARMVDGKPQPSARPFVHTTLNAATQEAARLANRLGDDFAVYQRVATESVDAGPVPKGWYEPAFNVDVARAWLRRGKGEYTVHAFDWRSTKQGYSFWIDQHIDSLTPIGRAILRKWIAQVEAHENATTGEVA